MTFQNWILTCVQNVSNQIQNNLDKAPVLILSKETRPLKEPEKEKEKNKKGSMHLYRMYRVG